MSPSLPAAFDMASLRTDFPILTQKVHGKKLVFLDSAASAQKPRAVIDAMCHMMETEYANVHRGIHWMSERATDIYEGTRDKIADFLNAGSREEIIFTRNSTEAINLLAHSYGRGILHAGDAVLISEMEHHANIVPWQMLRDAHGVKLRVCRITDDGDLDFDDLAAQLAHGDVKLVAITHMSNVLGGYTDATRLVRMAHKAGARVLLDGSQAAVHRPVDVTALDCDFYVFTGHKLYGPTGIGVLYAKRDILEAMPPFMGGGDMIGTVNFARSTWAEVPHKFEAGTPAIIEAAGLSAAIDYVTAIGFDAIMAHEAALTAYAQKHFAGIDGLHVVGKPADRGGVFSFTMDKAHSHDIATLLDKNGIAVRAGHHCAEPLMRRLGLDSTARASFALYTTTDEIDVLIETLVRIKGFFA
jgi:cysteine desulfurase/selenocysteine lyase